MGCTMRMVEWVVSVVLAGPVCWCRFFSFQTQVARRAYGRSMVLHSTYGFIHYISDRNENPDQYYLSILFVWSRATGFMSRGRHSASSTITSNYFQIVFGLQTDCNFMIINSWVTRVDLYHIAYYYTSPKNINIFIEVYSVVTDLAGQITYR